MKYILTWTVTVTPCGDDAEAGEVLAALSGR